MIKIISAIVYWAFRGASYIYPYKLYRRFVRLLNRCYSAWVSGEFAGFGRDSVVQRQLYLVGGKHITVGNRSCIGIRAVLTAWDSYAGENFSPEISIGDNVSIGDDCHITAINSIRIGNNVLTGKKVTITDNSHGRTDPASISSVPTARALYSAGPVIIEEGVWIGDKVTILPNVRIGKNSIVGANAVVTKDLPENCVAGGIPAKVLKLIK